MKLTTLKIDTMKPGVARQEIPDALLPGLYLIAQSSGAKSYAVRYRHHGRPRKLTLGRHPALTLAAARKLAGAALQKVAEGFDPGVEKRQQRQSAAIQNGMTVEGMFVDFLNLRVRKKNGQPIRERSTKETAHRLGLKRDPENPGAWIRTGNGVLSHWRGRRLAEVSRADVQALLEKMAARTPTLANRTYAALRTAFAWRVRRDPSTFAESPYDLVDRPAGEKERSRELTDLELASIWAAAGEMAYPFGPLVKMLILTGQRRSEVAGMKWSELDLKQKLWTLPPDRVKNGQRHVVPLSPQALAIITGVPRIAGSDFVFTAFGTVATCDFSRNKRQLAKRLPSDMAQWCLHDLRRACRTGLGRLGVPPHICEAVINHLPPKLIRTYDLNSYQAEKREALCKWARHVAKLAGE
jgi:integrase